MCENFTKEGGCLVGNTFIEMKQNTTRVHSLVWQVANYNFSKYNLEICILIRMKENCIWQRNKLTQAIDLQSIDLQIKSNRFTGLLCTDGVFPNGV